jgi:hypothetical protein
MFADSTVGFFVSVAGDIFLALSGSWLSHSDLEIMYSALDSPPQSDSPFSFRSMFDSSSSSCIYYVAIAFNVYISRLPEGCVKKNIQNMKLKYDGNLVGVVFFHPQC